MSSYINVKARRVVPLLFFIILILSEVTAVANEPGILNIKIADNIRSALNSFTLSEVADIEGPRDASRIAGMLRFSVPVSKTLFREDVVKAIQKSGIAGVRIELRMPSEVSVEVVGGVGQKGNISAEEGRNLSDMIKKLSNWKFEVEVIPHGQIPPGVLSGPASIVPGSASATLKFRDKSGRERSVPVRLTWYQPALIFKRSMKRGEVIRAEDIGERSIKIMAPNVYASSPDEVAGKSLRKSQQQGEIVLLSLVANVPIIQKGKKITLYVNAAGLMIESEGEAQQDGFINEIISVKNLSSKKIVSGIIRSPERVEVLK